MNYPIVVPFWNPGPENIPGNPVSVFSGKTATATLICKTCHGTDILARNIDSDNFRYVFISLESSWNPAPALHHNQISRMMKTYGIIKFPLTICWSVDSNADLILTEARAPVMIPLTELLVTLPCLQSTVLSLRHPRLSSDRYPKALHRYKAQESLPWRIYPDMKEKHLKAQQKQMPMYR